MKIAIVQNPFCMTAYVYKMIWAVFQIKELSLKSLLYTLFACDELKLQPSFSVFHRPYHITNIEKQLTKKLSQCNGEGDPTCACDNFLLCLRDACADGERTKVCCSCQMHAIEVISLRQQCSASKIFSAWLCTLHRLGSSCVLFYRTFCDWI